MLVTEEVKTRAVDHVQDGSLSKWTYQISSLPVELPTVSGFLLVRGGTLALWRAATPGGV